MRIPVTTLRPCLWRAAVLGILMLGAAPGVAATPRRIGIVLDANSPEAIEAAAAFVLAPWPSRSEIVFVERRVSGSGYGSGYGSGDGEEAREAIARLVQDGADAVVFLADEAALSRAFVQGCPVIGVAPTAADSSTDTALRIRGGILPSELPEMLSRLVGDPRRIGYVVPASNDPGQRTATAGDGPFVSVRLEGATPKDRAAAARPCLLPKCDVVCLAPEVSADDVAALAAALAGSGVPLVGSRRAHLDAGAAVVFRTSPRDVGAIAAALVVTESVGGATSSPRGTRPRVPQGVLREVHVGNARRLSFVVPLPFLVAADRIVLPPPVRR